MPLNFSFILASRVAAELDLSPPGARFEFPDRSVRVARGLELSPQRTIFTCLQTTSLKIQPFISASPASLEADF